MANSFTGTNTLQDPNRLAEMESRQRVNLGGIQDKGLAGLLAKDVGAQSASNSYGTLGTSNLGALNEAAKKYSTVDQSGWLDQYRQEVDPFIVGRSSLNKNVGYTVQDYLDDIEGKLSTTATPEGFTRKGIDNYKYDLQDSTGKSLGEKYYGIDDVLRNQYRGQLGNVAASTYVPYDPENPAPYDPFSGASWIQRTQQTPEQKMWEQFLQGRNAADYSPHAQLKAGAVDPWAGLGPAFGQLHRPDLYETVPGKQAYNWGNTLYDTQEAADAAREAQIMGRPGQYKSLMEKYEAAGSGGMGPQDWRGNYGANDKFSGASAISQLGGDAWMKVDPKTGQWNFGGYKIDPNELTPDVLQTQGYTPYVQQGKQKKGGWKSFISGALTGGLSYIMPKQFDPSPFEGKLVTEYGGNQSWRDYGDNGEAIKSLLARTPGGSLVMNEENLSKIPEFWNKNQHSYNTKSQDILIPNMDALKHMTIAGTIGDILFPQFTWGGGAAGSKMLWSKANQEATGQSSGDIRSNALKDWGKGYLSSSLGDIGGTIGSGYGSAIGSGLGTTAEVGTQIGAGAGRAIGSGLGSAAGTAIDTGSMKGFGQNFGTGALSSIIGAGLGAAGRGISSATGVDPRIMGALSRVAASAANSGIRGKKMDNKAWTQLAVNSALGGLRPLSSSSQYSE